MTPWAQAFAAALIAAAVLGAARQARADDALEDGARAAAVADGASTLAGMAAGAVEANPLLPGDPAGVVLVYAAKEGLLYLTRDLPEPERRQTVRGLGAAWWGATANNLLVALGASNPAGWAAALLTAVIYWHQTAPTPASTTPAPVIAPEDTAPVLAQDDSATR